MMLRAFLKTIFKDSAKTLQIEFINIKHYDIQQFVDYFDDLLFMNFKIIQRNIFARFI